MAAPTVPTVEKWDHYEHTLKGPDSGNPFTEVTLTAEFSLGSRRVPLEGFYDGAGTYKIRFMPDTEGTWEFVTHSNVSELDGATGSLNCTPAGKGNHGPVRVRSTWHLAYEDGTPHFSVGTTCYVWNHQGDELEEQTLQSLAVAPFNKIRMCVFPKSYDWNKNEPERYPFEGTPLEDWDFTRLNPEHFRHLETRIGQLRDLGIEADLILFHPYDRWGFSDMGQENDDRYLRYVVARLAAYRNVWWSFANEYDLMHAKTVADWDRFFHIVQECDPCQHLRGIHNCREFYDHGKPWVTHCSVQHSDLTKVSDWCRDYRKPVVVDECCYEGNIHHNWGNITGPELVHRFWEGYVHGGYVGHGETYPNEQDTLWWSHGGALSGTSPERIAFLRRIMEEGPELGVNFDCWDGGARASRWQDYFVYYYGKIQARRKPLNLPEDRTYTIEVIDTWEMTITPVEGTFSGKCWVDLPGKEGMALRVRATDR